MQFSMAITSSASRVLTLGLNDKYNIEYRPRMNVKLTNETPEQGTNLVYK